MSDKQGAPNLPPLTGGGNNNGTSNPGASQQTVSLQQVFASGQGLNVLTTPAGQQFVITSQVPGLTQVISSGSSSNASGLQQVGFQRIVNLAGGSSRVSVVGVASAAGSPLSSPSRQTATKVVLATSPKLVRTSLGNMFVAQSSQSASPVHQQQQTGGSASATSPARKKLRLTETTEKITAMDDAATSTTATTTTNTTTGYRRRIMEHKMKRMRAIREKYAENASELFFLHAGGNMMDFHTWKRRQPAPQYLHFLRQHRLDPEDDDEDLTVPLPPLTSGNDVAVSNVAGSSANTVAIAGNPIIATNVNTPVTLSGEVKITGIGATPVAVSTTLPAAVAQLSQQGQIPGRPQGGRHGMVFAIRATIQSPSQVTVTTTTAHPSPTSTIAPTIIIGGTPLVTEAPKPQQPHPPAAPVAPPMTIASSTLVCPSVEKSTITATTTTRATTITSTAVPSSSSSSSSSVATCCVSSVSSPQPIVKLVKLPSNTITSSSATTTTTSPTTPTLNASLVTAATPETQQNNQEQIVEKAKQEAYVMQRIAELQRDGLWPERRLPKVQEPPRAKAHWDYLLEEMVWLAADFAQERKWKKAVAKKCARMVQKYFQEKAIQAQKAEKSQELRLKKIAGFAAKEIKTFWANVEKLVEFKQQTRLEEKRKKALDQHLNFIVGQTEKYSTWLTEGLNKTDGAQSVPASINSSRISSPVPTNKQHSDDEFEPNQSSEDDEETIAKAEEEMKSTTNHKEEVELLKKESELPLEDLLKELPPNYLEERDKSLSPVAKEIVENENDATTDGDTEFTVASEESSDDENTIMEQEKLEGNANHKKELDELKAENDMTIDELMAKYGNMPATPMDVDGDTDHESVDDSDKEDAEKNEEKSDSESESEDETKANDEEDSQTQSDDETGVGLKSLLEDLSSEKPEDKNKTAGGEQCDNHNEMDDVAALAESIQPKGNTLLTTSVVTKIPFLLKHSLREYQHIGLDWLTTMYERKLNGILADEMGLGKTIQTIALLAHLACEKGNWGPHLIIVPTSVMLNWEMECKKWCPGFKILTYYGTQKERKQKRTGWTKPNAFHICITSYKLVIQDHQSFRRKKWKYLILDEAQNIKNFKSQRWQLLLNFQTQRRLLLTGTPLQNNLMELWSLMHFLMPNVFQSHREFKEWFSNPVTGMIEGNSEYNENIIRRLHKVLRPFLLRRLKTEVEKQLPKKYEHVVMCRLSKRQRYLYDDFMSRAKTKETLASGNLLSVINVLMQLRKVCNHPNLFEVRPTVSPFQMEAIEFVTASLAWSALDYHPFKSIDLSCLNLHLVDLEFTLTAFVAHRVKRLQTPRKLIEEIDSMPEAPPRCPSGKIKINVRLSNQTKAPVAPPPPPTTQSVQTKMKNLTGIVQNPRVGTSPLIKTLNNQSSPGQGVTLRVATGQHLQGYSVQLVQHQGSVKAIPVATLAHNPSGAQNVTTTSSAGMNAQRITMGNANIRDGLQRLTAQTVTVKQGDSLQRIAVPSFAQLVQTSTGRHIILTSNQQNTNTGELVSFPVMAGGQRLTVLSKSIMGLSTANKVVGSVVTTTTNAGGRVGMRVPPLNVNASPGQNLASLQPQQPQQQQPQQLRCGIVTRTAQKEAIKTQIKEQPKSEFYLPQLEEDRRQRRQSKLRTIATINERRCAACPLYGEDLFTALRIGKPSTGCQWHNGPTNCSTAKESPRTRRQFFSRTEALAAAIKSTEQIVEELKEVFQRFVVYVPAVRAPSPRFHVSHPPPHKTWAQQRLLNEIERQLTPKLAILHPIAGAMMTQFPDPRLIQYDCGKLQSLDRLLRKLKTGNHRVLIFTQMTRMLDVLEAFLNFHGHIYLRLDGATRVDQRQVLMERFNGDKRIFCFILSTRSGGVGVNLTGADTVIFYDSDWNPTMDAQAQDRCHRIGQTRDVHIYRLVSEKTVEENILKKANQKRLLGDLAIEGGNFTTAYFKSSTIQDLFNVDQTENDASARMADVLDQSKERERALQRELTTSTTTPAASTSAQPNEEKVAIGALESALAAAEEDLDVQAAKTAKAEAVADLAEFDENIPLDDADKEDNAQVSKAEQEVQHLVSQLTPVERYAMKFVEESEGTFSAAQLAAAERELEQQKKEWELDRLRALREEEERRLRLADDDEKPLTFGREDSQNQVNNTSSSSKRLAIKKRVSAHDSSSVNEATRARRASLRRSSNRSARDDSITESETETTTDTDDESESQDDDLVEDSPDEESSHTESQSQGDDEEDDVDDDENGAEDEDDDDYVNDDEETGDTRADNERNIAARGNVGYAKRPNRSNKSSERNNRWDLNSPRTRSRGNVKIDLWTLDVSPILPGVKPNFRNRRIAKKRAKRTKIDGKTTDDSLFALPMSPSPKRANNANPNDKNREDNPEKLTKKASSSSNHARRIDVSGKLKDDKIPRRSASNSEEKKNEIAEKTQRDERCSRKASSAVERNSSESEDSEKKMSNVEILMDEKMSEISRCEPSSRSDESVEHERSCAFSPDAKNRLGAEAFDVSSLISPAAPRLEIILSDIATLQKIEDKGGEKKMANQAESSRTPRGTRSKTTNVKRLTRTFDASFDESGVSSNYEIESVTTERSLSSKQHVTRSSHRTTTNFGCNSEDDSHEENDETARKELAAEAARIPCDSGKANETEKIEFARTEKRDENDESARAPRRSSTKRVAESTPEPEKLVSLDAINETIGQSTQRRRSVATRSRNKTQLDEIGRIIESVNEERMSAEILKDLARTNEIPEATVEPAEIAKSLKRESTSDFDDAHAEKTDETSTIRGDDKTAQGNDKNEEKNAVLVSKLSLESRVRLRRPDTPFPGVLTRRAKSTVPEASTSATICEASKFAIPRYFRKSLDGRRSARLNASAEAPEVERNEQNIGKSASRILTPKQPEIADSSRLILTRSNSIASPNASSNSPNCALSLKQLSRRSNEIADAVEASSSRPKTRSSLVVEHSPRIVSTAIERSTRRPRVSLDNGNFTVPHASLSFRKNRQAEPAKSTRKAAPIDGLAGTNSPQKKRPDTPLPSAQESAARVTRSGLDFATSVAKLRNYRRASTTCNENDAEKRESFDIDTNGNDLDREVYSKDDNDEASNEIGNERPQRTAKVVAILSLDSLSRGYKSLNSASATTPHCAKKNDDPDEETISVVDLESGDSENETGQENSVARRNAARRNAKRTRNAARDENDIQVVEINDDDDAQTPPTRKIGKLTNSTTVERLGSAS